MYSERYIGDRIRQRRNEIGLTQKELAAKINPGTSIETAPHTQVAQWESGKRKPGTDALIRLCNALDCDMDYILGAIDVPRRAVYDVREQTGLTGEAAGRLKQIHDKGQYGVVKDGYTLNIMDVLSEIITSPRFFPMMNAISFYLIHGGLLPNQTDDAVEDLSVDEYKRFHIWAKVRGLEIEKKEDVSEMHLQVAADELKNMFREILNNELKKEDGR